MKYPLLLLIKLYQRTISPLLGPVCRYYPSCSHYGYRAVEVHGAVKGSALTAWRILRCNPWSRGGVDHVPARKRPVWHRRVRVFVRERLGRHPVPRPSTAHASSGGAANTAQGA
ncbi:membrane protein insertion efficiency factor YidD [Streptomyces sp. 6N223]|uniref:membrane protein insertion efficiency factor YidD n=1 Tax=Streptomyces sp. 6N223 TaxID=3457412 RepID=UPI003FCF3F6E